MHKGYTINYFINFFKNIPDHRWTTDTLHREGTVQKCALGHCLTDHRTGELDGDEENNPRVSALQSFLNSDAADINDGHSGSYRELGATPRGRILRALRNRKRTGNIFGDKE